MSYGSSDQPTRKPRPRPDADPEPVESAEETTFRVNPARKKPTPRPGPYDDVLADPIDAAPDPEEGPVRPKAASKPKSKPKPQADEPRESGGWKSFGETMLIGGVRAGDLAVFCRQFGVYLDSGVGILKALASLRKQVAGTPMGPVVERMGVAIKRGETLADAAAKEPQAFDEMAISMLRVAEARGGMPETLKRLANHYDARQRFWRQARSAMIYPAVTILIALVVGGLLTIFVLPKLVEILEDTVRGRGVDLPGPTKLLMAISHFVKDAGWWLLPLLFVAGIFGFIRAYRTKATKQWIDEVIIRLPGLGGLVQLIDHGRFARTLSDLLEAGVDINSSLSLSADVLQFEPNRKAVSTSRAAVLKGSELAPALRTTRRFAPDMLAFVETGEETGQLPESLARVANDYEDRADSLIKNIGDVIKPLLMIVVGAIVGFIVVAFLMAYVAVLTSLMSGL